MDSNTTSTGLKIPNHVAIIMDGNGRWAKTKGKPRVFGHKNGVKAVREVTERCAELGVKYLTLYAFSTENWNRPKLEVNGLMSLLVTTIESEINTLMTNNVKLSTIGNIDDLPSKTFQALQNGIRKTENNSGLHLILALNYSGRWDIVQAVKKLLKEESSHEKEISYELFGDYLSTSNIPDPDMVIRTSGEIRISNFLLWQIAYSELIFTDIMWPEFDKKSLDKCLEEYRNRDRRYGKA